LWGILEWRTLELGERGGARIMGAGACAHWWTPSLPSYRVVIDLEKLRSAIATITRIVN
jgi:hypothetical protein